MKNTIKLLICLTINGVFAQVTDTGGNVGIGTTTPNAKLDVRFLGEGSVIAKATSNGTHGASNIITDAASNFPSRFLFREDGNNKGWIDHYNGKISIRNSASKVLLTTDISTENVGIGTSNPQKKLHINAASDDGIAIASGNTILGDNGSGTFTQLLFWNGINAYYGRSALGVGVSNHYFRTNGTNRMVIDLNGNIGIGTTNPSEKLDVNGLIKIPQANNQDNNSLGIIAQINDDFLYDNQYINNYAFGFHGYQDGSTTYTEPMNT